MTQYYFFFNKCSSTGPLDVHLAKSLDEVYKLLEVLKSLTFFLNRKKIVSHLSSLQL